MAFQQNTSAPAATPASRQTRGFWATPTSLTFSALSNAAGGGVTKEVSIFNNDTQNALVTTNDSGAGSITYVWGDNNTGKSYNALFARNQGLRIVKMTVVATNFTSGAQIAAALSGLGFKLMADNCQGDKVPMPTNIMEGFSNTSNQSGTLTLNTDFIMNSLEQVRFQLPANTRLDFILFTEASPAA